MNLKRITSLTLAFALQLYPFCRLAIASPFRTSRAVAAMLRVLGFVGFALGSHQAVAGASSTAITRSVATVVVLLPPFITSDLVSQTSMAGNEAVFSVAATGSAPLTYVWYLNGSLIPSLAGPTLTLPRIDASDEGDYQVVISNGSGDAISATARLTVDDPVLDSLQLEFVGMERGGGFRMRVKGPLNSSYVVWASSDLSDWAAVTTGRAVAGLLSFLDSDAPRHSQRFYRASLAP